MPHAIKPITLLILDGWGISDAKQHNPTQSVATPIMDELLNHHPHTALDASGQSVGLPEGQIGNSEVGHLHIGAGRKVPQDLTRINDAIANGTFANNSVLLEALQYAKQQHKPVHLLGLVSPGGVHSYDSHFAAMLELMASQHVTGYIHAFLDGRDVAPKSAKTSLTMLSDLANTLGTGHIASIIGRYYAMDRDRRWQRTQLAYELLTQAQADFSATDPITALTMAYNRGETDEFVKPTIISNDQHNAITINDGDVIIFMNFRADRARQLSTAISHTDFNDFDRKKNSTPSRFITMTNYGNAINSTVAFPAFSIPNGLGEFLAQHRCRQLRIAETEKFAHVTYFLNGGQEQVFPNEQRILVPSPKVATYDLQPEMSAIELTDRLVEAINSKQYDAIMCNYANPDMVGHTGIEAAAKQAVAVIDSCIGRIKRSAEEAGMQLLITADHGNVEQMYDEETQQPHTAHTNNLVPLIYVGDPAEFNQTSERGALDDIAPTLLHLMGLEPPTEMTGRNLITLKSKPTTTRKTTATNTINDNQGETP